MSKCKRCGEDHAVELELKRSDFRVVVFGSARIKQGDKLYDMVYELGEKIGELGADIVTGGGPGLMEAANAGFVKGDMLDGMQDGHSIGVRIDLPFEQGHNKHLDIVEHHERFSTRLDAFMTLSNVVIVTPGGIGTALELFYTWQLIQVGHICKTPIILIGKMWKELIKWVEKYQVKEGLVSPEDLDVIHVVNTVDEAVEIVEKTKAAFEDGAYDACLNWEVYKARL